MKYLMRYDNDDSLSVSNFSMDHPIVARYDDDGSVGYRRFKKVDYVTMGGTSKHSHFIIPYKVNQNTQIAITFKFTSVAVQQVRVWQVGADADANTANNMNCQIYINGNDKLAYSLRNTSTWQATTLTPSTTPLYHIHWNNGRINGVGQGTLSMIIKDYANEVTWDSTLHKFVPGTETTLASLNSSNLYVITNTAAQNLYLCCASKNFASTVDNKFFQGKLYHCSIWDNDILLYDLCPIKYLNQGALYNRVDGSIFVNQSQWANEEGKMTGYGFHANDLMLPGTSDEQILQEYYKGWLFCDF